MNNIEKSELADPQELLREEAKLETVNLDKGKFTIGLLQFLFFTLIAVLVFFIPFQINGTTEILFGFIYNSLIEFFGLAGVWAIALLTAGNAAACFYGKFIARSESPFHRFYEHDSKIQFFIYSLGAVYALLYTLEVTFAGFPGPASIVGDGTGGLIAGIALAVLWIIPLGAVFIPLFVNYGSIDFIGTLLEPIMRPVFKVPGKSAVDAIASFLTSSSVAVLFTSKLYKMNVYTKKEAMTIATSFSAVSIGFAAVVIDTAGLMDHFIKVYFSSFVIAFLITAILVRIPPLSLKPRVFADQKPQTEEERSGEKYTRDTLKIAANRAVKRAYVSNSFFKETTASLMEGLAVLPKVLCMLFAIGVTSLILAEYTPIFEIVGWVFVPLLQLLNVPDAAAIAPALTLGLAEMFLPVLYIADAVGTLDIGARYLVTAVSMVQIIFFAETGAVMLSTGLPVKVWELIGIFFLRTLLAIPIVALFMHLLF